MTPLRFLVTAGGTRESIDRVRVWGNVFTGGTGYRIARALSALGPVTLLTSNAEHAAEAANQPADIHPISATLFTDYSELRRLLESEMSAGTFTGVYMTAAVSDYTPTGAFEVTTRSRDERTGEEVWRVRPAQAAKVKSTFAEMAVLAARTEKLVDLFRTRWNYRGLLVKFKLEVGISSEALLEIGRSSRRASGADYLVANTLDMVEGPDAGAYLIGDDGERWIPRGELPAAMAMLAKTHGGR